MIPAGAFATKIYPGALAGKARPGQGAAVIQARQGRCVRPGLDPKPEGQN